MGGVVYMGPPGKMEGLFFGVGAFWPLTGLFLKGAGNALGIDGLR